jgi:hypothetical protein
MTAKTTMDPNTAAASASRPRWWQRSALLAPLANRDFAPTLIGAGILSGIATFAFLFVPGMRDTAADGRLSIKHANPSH